MNKLGIPSANNFVPVTPGSSMPAGTIISYSGSIASFTSTVMADSTTLIHKDGWAVCNGASVPKATYSQLFARVDTIWNASVNPLTGSNQSAPADATNNFRVPNLQGTFLRGVGDFTDNTMDTTLAGYQAQKTAKNGLAVTNNEVPTGPVSQDHSHSGTTASGGVDHYHGYTDAYANRDVAASIGAVGLQWVGAADNARNTGGASAYAHTHGFSTSGASVGHTHNVTSNVTLGAGDSETRPQNVGVYYLIKLYDNLAAVDVYIPAASAGVSGLVNNAAGNLAGTPIKCRTDGVAVSAGDLGQILTNTVRPGTNGNAYSSYNTTAINNSTYTEVIYKVVGKGTFLVFTSSTAYSSGGSGEIMSYIAVSGTAVTNTKYAGISSTNSGTASNFAVVTATADSTEIQLNTRCGSSTTPAGPSHEMVIVRIP